LTQSKNEAQMRQLILSEKKDGCFICVNQTARLSAVWEFFQKMRQQKLVASPRAGLTK